MCDNDGFDSDGQSILTDPEASFVAEFSDGYSFRNMFEYLRVTNSHGTFIFKKDEICYMQGDDNNTILNQIEILVHELPDYKFKSSTPEIVIGINIQDIRSITKTIGKKDSVILYKQPNSNDIQIQIVNSSRGTGRQNYSKVRLQRREIPDYSLPDFQNDEKHPNFTIPSADFSRTCTSISSVKCDKIIIHGYPRGTQFDAVMHGGVVQRYERMGSCEMISGIVRDACILDENGNPGKRVKMVVKSDGPVPSVVVRTSTIKALSKLNNLSANGTIKFYMEPDNPIKIMSKIGTYGTLRVYIKSYE